MPGGVAAAVAVDRRRGGSGTRGRRRCSDAPSIPSSGRKVGRTGRRVQHDALDAVEGRSRRGRRVVTSPSARLPGRQVTLTGVAARDFSSWPPNSLRIAESTLSAKSASPRELNRSKSALVSTGAGTPSSIAASAVQRPSPESRHPAVERRRARDRRAAPTAVRSSSHDATTLPRRHTSATCRGVDVVLVVLRVAQRRGLGVGLVGLVSPTSACWRMLRPSA